MSIFISYSRNDNKYADWIYDFLSHEGQKIFLDRESLNPGTNWLAITEKNIISSEVIILLWSTHSASSTMVMHEITMAKMNKRKIIPCLIDETPIIPLIKNIQAIYLKKTPKFEATLKSALNIQTHEEKNNLSYQQARKRYLKSINAEYKYLKILGKGDQFNIGDIYMPLKVSFDIDDTSIKKILSAENLIDSSILKIIILGSPGSGKSTLFKFLAFNISNAVKHLPIYIRINDLMRTNESLYDYISKKVNGFIGRVNGEIISSNENFCRAGTILMLDGFDEIIDIDKEEFIKRLASFQTAHPDCKIIISSRYSGYRKIDGFEVCQMNELTDEDIESYIWSICDDKNKDKIWNLIKNDSRIFELAKTPFLLAMMASVPETLGHRATQRAIIFKNCIKYLIKEIDWEDSSARKNISESENLHEILEKALKIIAVRFYKLDAKESFIDEEILFIIRNLENITMSPIQILNILCDYTGLLQRTGKNLYFIHRSVWEYFVAEGMKDEPLDNLINRSNITIWEEPIRLFIGLTPKRNLENVFTKLWAKNKGLALRAMTDLSFFPKKILKELLGLLNKEEKLNVILQLKENLNNMVNELDIKRALIDTLTPLLQIEKNSQVIYESIKLLEFFESKHHFIEATKLIHQILDLKNVEKRLDKYLNNSAYNLDFICVPSGRFKMGTDKNNRTPDEKPEHLVTLDSFCISIFPVTNKLYYEDFPFIENDSREERSFSDNQPVVFVTWYDAYVFAKWLGCELPTEAQWEYACRSGGDDDNYLFDENRIEQYAWYIKNSNNTTKEVGLLKPNSLGIYDMLGNVREWCNDWFSANYYKKCVVKGIVNNPKGENSANIKVLRGGCFDWNSANLVPTYRNYNPPSNSYFANGFRLVYNKEIDKLKSKKND